MTFSDHYATLGVAPGATRAEIKRAYRKLARKYHPDVSREPDAEARFKAVAEAHEALVDDERRAAHDASARRHARGPEPPPRQPPQHDDERDFFEAVFGRAADHPGADHHASVAIDLMDACHGARRSLTLHRSNEDDEAGPVRTLEVTIPKGVRDGQRLRLAGQGGAGHGRGPAGDLYLRVQILPHPRYRLHGADIEFDLPLSPWEAALGATVTVSTPDGEVQLAVPAGAVAGRRLRLKGRGLPGRIPGDLHAVLAVVLPPARTDADKAAYAALARAFDGFSPRDAAGAGDTG